MITTRNQWTGDRSLAVFLSCFACLAATPIARCDTATVRISGQVTAVASISPGTPTPIQSTQLTQGVSDLAVVTISELSNSKSGYTVLLQSGNAGVSSTPKLVGGSTSEAIPYTIKYGGSAVSFVNGQAVVTDSSNKTVNTGVQKVLSVSIPTGHPAADVYSDTLTLTLVNK